MSQLTGSVLSVKPNKINGTKVPLKPCWVCGGNEWWWRESGRWGSGEWLCSRCHPEPERQKLKQEAISLRYDYGLSELAIVDKLQVPQPTIHRWIIHNSHKGIIHNPIKPQLLEGDCVELIKDIPDNSIDSRVNTTLYPPELELLAIKCDKRTFSKPLKAWHTE